MNHIDEYASIAEIYDSVPFYEDRLDVKFYLEAALAQGGPVLELGCGTGRVLIPTAREGVTITGIDSSRSMLRTCESRLKQEHESVRVRAELLLNDMRQFTVPRRFSVAMIPFRPFQHLLTVQDQLECLAAIRSHLDPGGRLFFDVYNPPWSVLALANTAEDSTNEPTFEMPDGRTVFRTHRVLSHDRLTQITHREIIYYVTHKDGRTERLVQALDLRSTYRFEAEHLLARAGFELEEVYSDFTKTPYGTSHLGELIFVARRP